MEGTILYHPDFIRELKGLMGGSDHFDLMKHLAERGDDELEDALILERDSGKDPLRSMYASALLTMLSTEKSLWMRRAKNNPILLEGGKDGCNC